MNYYDVVVGTARMIGKYNAPKKEIEKLAKRMFEYTGKVFDESSFAKAFTEFRMAGTRNDFKIYA